MILLALIKISTYESKLLIEILNICGVVHTPKHIIIIAMQNYKELSLLNIFIVTQSLFSA